MIQRALASAFRALSRPAALAGLTFAIATLAVAKALLGQPSTIQLGLAGLAIGLVRWALLIGIQAVALAMVRGDTDAASRAWVAPGKLLKLGLVSIGGGIAAAVTVFVAGTAWLALKPFQPAAVLAIALIGAAGLYVLVLTSQYVLLILDDDGVDAIEAIGLSIDLTKGHRLELLGLITVMAILAFSMAISVVLLGHRFGQPTVNAVTAAIAACTIPIASCVNAAVYIELLRDQDSRLEGIAADLAPGRSGSLPSSV